MRDARHAARPFHAARTGTAGARGLTPAQALKAATHDSAQALAQDGDRGTIAPGQRADILLFDGKPWETLARCTIWR
jgi:imidazolonepropionase-like amidohydrolase